MIELLATLYLVVAIGLTVLFILDCMFEESKMREHFRRNNPIILLPLVAVVALFWPLVLVFK